MKNGKFAALAALALAGCFTLEKSEYPQVAATSAPEGRDITVKVDGFLATRTDYMAVYGYTTHHVLADCRPGYGCRYWAPATVITETYVPQVSQTTAFRDRASAMFEKAGFLVQAPNPAYRVNVAFAGPFKTNSERWAEAGWSLLTVFTADRAVETWTAHLSIHDTATGRLLFDHEYEQRYQATTWGPVPFFCAATSDDVSPARIKTWCLSALVDRAVADATAFLASR